MKIFFYEMMLIALSMIILAIASTAVTTVILNNEYAKEIETDTSLTIISYKWINVPITIAAVMLIVATGIITPLSKITKLNVIEAIKGTANK